MIKASEIAKDSGNNTRSQFSSLESTGLIEGGVNTEHDFRIDGVLEGNVTTKGKIIIGKNGHLLGTATCLSAEVFGHLNGELRVENLLTLRESANVEGRVFLGKLAVEPGAVLNATCYMHKHSQS